MKKAITFLPCMATTLMLGFMLPSLAEGDEVYYEESGSPGQGEMVFHFTDKDASSPVGGAAYPKVGESFTTFCLEMSDAIFMEREYQVDYSRSAKKNDQDVGDPISKGTARLYTEFHRGTINSFVNDALGGGFDFDTIYGTRTKAINALQFTIWWLEDEIEDEINTDENDFLAALKATGGVLTDWKADYDPGSDIPGVYVMNLSGFDENEQTVYYQDVLVAPVPEPATLSLWALGLAGCAGAGAYRRRRQKA